MPVERLFDAFADERSASAGCPAPTCALRTATAPKSARYDWEDGSTRVIVGFEDLAGERRAVWPSPTSACPTPTPPTR